MAANMASARFVDDGTNLSYFCVGLLACFSLLLAVYVHNFTMIAVHDDELYMYYTGLALIDPSGIEAITRRASEAFAYFGYTEEQIKRFDFRYEYRKNYLLHSSSIAACRLVNIPSEFYAGSVRNCISQGMIVGNIVVVSTIVWALFNVRDRVLLISSITLFSLLFILILTHFHVPNYRLSKIDDPFAYFLLSFLFFISPGLPFDLFGISARSAFTACLVAFFVLRWGGFQRHSYMMLIPMSFIHLTYGGIFAFMIVAVDLVSRPAVFRDRVTSLAVVGMGGLFFWRESLWKVFGGLEIAIGTIGMIAMLAVLAFAVRLKSTSQIKHFLMRLQQTEIVKLDILLFAAGAVLVSVLAFVMTTGDTLEARFTWMELSSRPLALIRIPVFLGLIVLGYRMIDRKFVDRFFICFSAIALSMSAFLWVRTAQYEWSYADEESSFQELTDRTLSDDVGRLPEKVVYYHLLRDAELGTNRLLSLIEREHTPTESK